MKSTTLKKVASLEKEANNTNLTSEELIKKEDIVNTPFTIVETETEYFAVMGGYRLTEKYDKTEYGKEQIKAIIQEISWNRITQVILCLIDNNNKQNK